MARDSMNSRFSAKQKKKQLDDIDNRGRSFEDMDAERELIENTDKVEPIRTDRAPGRNDPCPCGSGKKYKKCCGAK